MAQTKYTKTTAKHRNMDTTPNGPLEDIKKLGQILMKHASEKEYYRFLRIQEQCRLKWQATMDKFTQILKEHEKCAMEKDELVADLKHIDHLWQMEKKFRCSMEHERNFYKMKVIRTYEYLRYDRGMEVENRDKTQDTWNDLNDKNKDEITSTGSFLSDLSEISQTEDDYIENAEAMLTSRQLAKEFENLEHFATSTALTNKSLCEKTFQINGQDDECEQCLDSSRSSIDDDSECNRRVQTPPKHAEKHLHTTEEVNRAKLQIPKEYRALREISSNEANADPIYEQTHWFGNGSLAPGNKENWHKTENAATKTSNRPSYEENSKYKLQNCNHTFIHQFASRSVDCFHCSKKFNFGILAFKCTSCGVFVHHNCKSLLKSRTKAQRHMKSNTKEYFISDYVTSYGPSVPPLIVHCVNEVETRGLSERGIYRVSGSEKEIKALKERFLQNEDAPDLSNIDMHVVCGCIKIFLRSLREPLIPTRLWSVFSNAVINFDGDSTDGNIQSHLQYEIGRLPKANRDTLAFLVLHLQRVATCDAVQMPISNLATVFGPTIVGYSNQKPHYATILGETVVQQNVMQHFLNIPTDYWFSFISEDLDM
ncbi:rac GTPase-activating protein 1-like [Sitodiplosis mosellana]|uniref:rac GTPase-activating protein 1-like n=1 Tax=Sitodiplosis mosellana TaxID=263140 RepID=UPI00244486BA|nr:rac GTPase-activating protein 1-like [Sitodiplosis mosellana]